MNFLLPEELIEFNQILEKFFSAELSLEKTKKYFISEDSALEGAPLENIGKDASIDSFIKSSWKKVSDLGAFVAALPESAGGLNLGFRALAAVIEEQGKVLAPLPISETLAFGVAPFIGRELTEDGASLLERVAAGSEIVTGAFSEAAEGNFVFKPSKSKAGMSLAGSSKLVAYATLANGIIVPAKCGKGVQLFYVKSDPSKVKISRTPTFDLIRPFYEIEVNSAEAKPLLRDHLSDEAWRKLVLTVGALLSSELHGISKVVIDMTVDYVKTRKQYGQPIGSFQAVQHKLADMLADSEQVKALSRYAMWYLDSSNENADEEEKVLASAWAMTSDKVPTIVERAIQAHGGIGFTFEYDLHLFLRRALTNSRLLCLPNELFMTVGKLALGSN